MSQPAHVTLSSSIAREHHDTLTTAVALAAMLVNTDLSECEVHIKQGSRPAHGLRTHGTLDAYSRSHMSGMAYYWYRDPANGDKRPGGLPGSLTMTRMQPGMRYLVTLKLTRDFAYGVYPYEWRYARYKTAQPCMFLDWTEELLHLTVHEFTHIAQYVNHWQRSEIYCEQVAHAALYKARRLLASATTNNTGKAASR